MKIFLATPIAGFESDIKLAEYRTSITNFIYELKKEHEVWAEADKIFSIKDYDTPQYSLKFDMSKIKESHVFLLHYPQRIVTSALFELGVAVALQKKIIIVVPKRTILPFLVQGIPEALKNAYIVESELVDSDCINEVLKVLNILK